MTRNNLNLNQISISYTSILWWEIRAIQTKILNKCLKRCQTKFQTQLFTVLGEPNSKIDYNLKGTERDAFSRRFDEASSNSTQCHWPVFNAWDSSCKDTTLLPHRRKKNGKKTTEMWQYKITTTQRNLSVMAVRIWNSRIYLQDETKIGRVDIRNYNLCIKKLKNKLKESKSTALISNRTMEKNQFELRNSSQALSDTRKNRKTEAEEKGQHPELLWFKSLEVSDTQQTLGKFRVHRVFREERQQRQERLLYAHRNYTFEKWKRCWRKQTIQRKRSDEQRNLKVNAWSWYYSKWPCSFLLSY